MLFPSKAYPQRGLSEFVATGRTATGIYRVDGAHAAVELSFDRPAGRLQMASVTLGSRSQSSMRRPPTASIAGMTCCRCLLSPAAESWLNHHVAQRNLRQPDRHSGRKSARCCRRKFTMRWHAISPEDVAARRAWICSRYGRWLAFWLPSWQKDLVSAANVGYADTTRVFAPKGTISLGRTTFDLEIETTTTVYYRRITAASASPTVDGPAHHRPDNEQRLRRCRIPSQFGRISYLRCVRFDADRIEFLASARAGVAMTVPCIEVPVPDLRSHRSINAVRAARRNTSFSTGQRHSAIPSADGDISYGGDTYTAVISRAAIKATSETTRLALKNHLFA